MATNDRIILEQILEQKKTAIAPAKSEQVFFELFTSEQILKDYDLSYDEINSGIVGGTRDGGIDSIYTFVNGELQHEDSELEVFKKNVVIQLIIIQSTTGKSFNEKSIDRLNDSIDDLLDLSKPINDFDLKYNSKLIEIANRFRYSYVKLAGKFPELAILFYYASLGDSPHPNVKNKVSKLKETVSKHFSSAKHEFHFLGALELLTLARRFPKTSYELKLAETPISTTGDVGFVCLVRLHDFYKFITNEIGELIRHIFEANVRDYQGKTEVNEEIQASLKENKNEDFWWLNNGITIVADQATQSGKALTIENPEVVNGLQTSMELHKYFKELKEEGDERTLLVRVIVPAKNESRDRIIKATNSQTTIPPASLRATDKIQRDIEEYFKPLGFYYDRRKNYYKNQGKPVDRIVSIPHLAQAVMAILLMRADTARARPSSLIKKDDEYSKLFNQKHPIELYLSCAKILKKTEAFLNSNAIDIEPRDKYNIKFYLAMHVALSFLTTASPRGEDIAKLCEEEISEESFQKSFERIKAIYYKLGGTDQIAKGPEFLTRVKTDLEDFIKR